MAVTVKGYQGTISDADMATQLGAHHGPTVRSTADLGVSAGSGRQVNVAAGTSDHAFVKYVSDAVQSLTLSPPASGGKWYLIAINRQWSPTNTAVLEAVDIGSTTDGTVPTFIPVAALNAANAVLRKNPGTAGSTTAFGAHAPLSLVHVRAADTTLTTFDLRLRRTGSGIVTAPNLAALVFANLVGHIIEGALVTVGTFQTAAGGYHERSTWQRRSDGQQLELVGRAKANEGSDGSQNVRNEFYNYSTIFMGAAWGLFLVAGETDLWINSTSILYRWNGSTWLVWEGKPIPGSTDRGPLLSVSGSSAYTQDGASNYNSEFTTELRRSGRTCTLDLNLNVGNNGCSQGYAPVKLPPGFRGLAGKRQRAVFQIGDANSLGFGTFYVIGESIVFYQWGPWGGGPNGQIPANQPVLGTITYIAEE